MAFPRIASSSASAPSLDVPGWIERCCLPFHLLNLDAPCIAVLWEHSFARWMGVSLATPEYLVLGLVVWSIYTSDRLIDVSSSQVVRRTARHQFTKRYAELLRSLVIVIMPFSAILAYVSLDRSVLYAGIALSAFVLGYFGLVHRTRRLSTLSIPKEVLTGLLYGAGTVLPPLSHANCSLVKLLPVLPFVILCTVNCFAIEVWESQRLLQGESAPSRFAQQTIAHLQTILLLTSLFIAFLLVCFGLHACFCSLLISTLSFAFLSRHTPRYSNNLLRLLPDLPLLSPLLFLALR